MKHAKIKARNMAVNINVVSAGIQVCKITAAGIAYEIMVVFFLSCGVDVGNIGHGQ